MPATGALLECIGSAALDVGVPSVAVVQGDVELARAVWNLWDPEAHELEIKEELLALAQAPAAEIDDLVSRIVASVCAGQSESYQKLVRGYLRQTPATIRQFFRRPSDPQGLSLPADFRLRHPADLLPLLPARLPWFEQGDRPAGVGDWELADILDMDDFGESWRALPPRSSPRQPALLKFFLHSAQKAYLREEGLAQLNRVIREVVHPGLLKLRNVFFDADPPCLEYEHFEAGTLVSLIHEWHNLPTGPQPLAAARAVKALAEALGQPHRLQPPLVHGKLRPSVILVRQKPNQEYEFKIANLGLGAAMPGDAKALRASSADPLIYASPEQLRGEPANPRDDVYALGILWYQLLTGNQTAGRPGGAAWRRKLADKGLAPALIDLLESCFEDDPSCRPADAADLAEKLEAALSASPARLPGVSPPVLSGESTPGALPSRGRTRRADVAQLFESLQKPERELAKRFTNDCGMELVLIQPGTFLMGSPTSEASRRENEGPQHEVTLANPFYLGVHPVTQAQFERIMAANPSKFHLKAGGGFDHPMENVTWHEAVAFCQRLTALPEERQAGRSYRLPTEAEWEYGCRAGTSTAYAFGLLLTSALANFDARFSQEEKGTFLEKTTKVGTYPANNFGLCDMHGNVWEWCADWHDVFYYQHSTKRTPQGPSQGQFRVIRGGSWRNHAGTCRSAYRNGLGPNSRDRCTGFRVVCDVS